LIGRARQNNACHGRFSYRRGKSTPETVPLREATASNGTIGGT
jgi:hypothetical protein